MISKTRARKVITELTELEEENKKLNNRIKILEEEIRKIKEKK